MDKIRKPTASRGMQSLFSLRHAIILSVVLSIFYSACMLFLYIYGFRNAYQNEIYTTFDSLSQNIESQLEKIFSRSMSFPDRSHILPPFRLIFSLRIRLKPFGPELHRRILCLST